MARQGDVIARGGGEAGNSVHSVSRVSRVGVASSETVSQCTAVYWAPAELMHFSDLVFGNFTNPVPVDHL